MHCERKYLGIKKQPRWEEKKMEEETRVEQNNRWRRKKRQNDNMRQ